MKCASCYADNPYFMTVCTRCGRETDPILVCPAGHIMAAGELRCPRCTTRWPEVSSHTGPPILRGVMLALEGRMVHDGREVGLLELRDAAGPIGLAEARGPRDVNVTLGQEDSIVARVLVRPEGVTVCSRSDRAPGGQSELTYAPMPSGSVLRVGSASLRVFLFDVPAGVGANLEEPLT